MGNETTDTGGSGKAVNKATNTSNNVDSHSPKYEEYMEKSALPRTLAQGTRGMKAAGKQFLPSPPLETPASYQTRLENSVLLNAFRKTCSFLSGQVFQVDIVFEDEVPDDFTTYSTKIDHLGNSINVFAKRVFMNGLMKGASHILIDAPKSNGETRSRAEEKENNIRPYFKEIKPESIIGWRLDDDGSLAQVRITQKAEKHEGEFGTTEVNQILVLEKGSWRTYEQDQSGKTWTQVEEGVFSITDKIPLFSFIPGDEWTALTGETPLMDLAELNLAHWRSRSDQTNILHVGRVPFLFGKNVDLKTMPVATTYMVTSTDENSDIKFVEIQGAAISAGADDLKELEAKMALYGLQQLIPRVGNMTATEKSLTSGESNSSLGTWATEFESTLQAAFECFGEFINQEFPEDSINLNKEYNYGMFDSQEGQLILKAVQDGVLSAQGAFREMKRRGIFEEHAMWDENQDEMEEEDREGNDGLTGGEFFQNTNLGQ